MHIGSWVTLVNIRQCFVQGVWHIVFCVEQLFPFYWATFQTNNHFLLHDYQTQISLGRTTTTCPAIPPCFWEKQNSLGWWKQISLSLSHIAVYSGVTADCRDRVAESRWSFSALKRIPPSSKWEIFSAQSPTPHVVRMFQQSLPLQSNPPTLHPCAHVLEFWSQGDSQSAPPLPASPYCCLQGKLRDEFQLSSSAKEP